MLIPEWANREYSRLRETLRGSADQLPSGFRLRLFIDHLNKKVYVVAPRGPRREHRRIPAGFDTILESFPQPKTVERTILGVTLRHHPAGFVQANQFITESLYNEAMKIADPQKTDILCEFYSGSGFLCSPCADCRPRHRCRGRTQTRDRQSSKKAPRSF